DIAIIGNNLVDQAGKRLAAIAAVIGTMGTKVDAVQMGAEAGQIGRHALMNGLQGDQIVIASRYPGLVGGDHHAIAGAIQTSNGLGTAGDRNPLSGSFDVGVGIFIDNAVPVEND